MIINDANRRSRSLSPALGGKIWGCEVGVRLLRLPIGAIGRAFEGQDVETALVPACILNGVLKFGILPSF